MPSERRSFGKRNLKIRSYWGADSVSDHFGSSECKCDLPDREFGDRIQRVQIDFKRYTNDVRISILPIGFDYFPAFVSPSGFTVPALEDRIRKNHV